MTTHTEYAVIKDNLYADGFGNWTEDIDQALLFVMYVDAKVLQQRLVADGIAAISIKTERTRRCLGGS